MKMRNPFKGRIQKSFLERNQLIIGILGVLFVLGGSALALLLSGGFFASTYTVTASFADAAGVKGGDEVLVAGLEAGTISGVEIKDGAVEITMDVNSDVEMPADSQAEIIVETLMGKKSVQLHGGSDDSGELGDGDTIPIERTDTPVELLDLQDTSVPLLEKSDAESFESFMVSISKITSGKEQQVTQLLQGFADTTKAIDTKSAELARLIESFKILSTAFADKDETIVSLIDNFDIVLANLSERRGARDAVAGDRLGFPRGRRSRQPKSQRPRSDAATTPRRARHDQSASARSRGGPELPRGIGAGLPERRLLAGRSEPVGQHLRPVRRRRRDRRVLRPLRRVRRRPGPDPRRRPSVVHGARGIRVAGRRGQPEQQQRRRRFRRWEWRRNGLRGRRRSFSAG